jgi:hypothetical protein
MWIRGQSKLHSALSHHSLLPGDDIIKTLDKISNDCLRQAALRINGLTVSTIMRALSGVLNEFNRWQDAPFCIHILDVMLATVNVYFTRDKTLTAEIDRIFDCQ